MEHIESVKSVNISFGHKNLRRYKTNSHIHWNQNSQFLCLFESYITADQIIIYNHIKLENTLLKKIYRDTSIKQFFEWATTLNITHPLLNKGPFE